MRRIDYRNASYQGEINQNGNPHGLGIAIDQKNIFCLAEWNEGMINGAFFLIFPDFKIFCGRMKDRKLSGVCCFYLEDNIQTFINYSQSSPVEKSSISVVPFCKIILEIDLSEQVRRHIKYGSEGELEAQLKNLFGNNYSFEEFKDWREFLLINFIRPYRNRLYWIEFPSQKYYEYFLGIKNEGLGIKMLVFYEDDQAHQFKGDPVVISAMGTFSNQHAFSGYGYRMIDFQQYKMVEEGEFEEMERNTMQFNRSARGKEVVKMRISYLVKSNNFQNSFLDFTFVPKLQGIYSKINVAIIQENQKIAQLILENPNQYKIDKTQPSGSRPRNAAKTPRKLNTRAENNESNNLSGGQIPQINSNQRQVNPELLSQAQRSIYSSIDKLKKHDRSQRTDVLTILDNSTPKDHSRDKIRNNTYVPFMSKTPIIIKQHENANQTKIQERSRSKSPQPAKKKYLYEQINSGAYDSLYDKRIGNRSRNYQYFQEFRANYSDLLKLQNRRNQPYEKDHYYLHNGPHYRRQNNFAYRTPKYPQLPTTMNKNIAQNKVINVERPIGRQAKIQKSFHSDDPKKKEHEDLLKYFNTQIQNSKQATFIEANPRNQQSPYKNLQENTTPTRNRTPGKIINMKKGMQIPNKISDRTIIYSDYHFTLEDLSFLKLSADFLFFPFTRIFTARKMVIDYSNNFVNPI